MTRLGTRDVSRIGYGAMQLEHADPAVAHRVLAAAIDLGVTHIDTAAFYGDDVSNRLIRAALFPYPAELVIATKVGAVRSGATLVPAQRPAELRAQVEHNLATLGVERIGLVNLRRADAQPGIIAEGDQLVELDDQLAELIALRGEGKLEAIGLSNVSVEQVEQALPAGIACVQNHYSVLQRDAEPVLSVCRANGLAWVPFFPLGSAFDRLESVADNATVIEVAGEAGATPAQVGLAWLLAHYEDTLLIPGTRSLTHLAENMAVTGVALRADQLSRLDALGS